MIRMLKLRELRKNCGLTMKELGAEIGVAESTISQYETGKRQPDYETLLKLGEFFGVSVDYLLTGDENKKAPTQEGERDHAIDHVDEELKDYLDELRNRSEMRMLFSVAKNANKQKIEAIVKFIEGLEEQK